MLVPYEALCQLPSETLDNLIKEYLLTQIEDGSFDALEQGGMQDAIVRCRTMLKRGELVVEYSQDNDSIGIRNKSDLKHQQARDYD